MGDFGYAYSKQLFFYRCVPKMPRQLKMAANIDKYLDSSKASVGEG